MKSAIRDGDYIGKPFVLPRLTQKELAAAIRASESAVSRAINSKDLELKVMFEALGSPDLIRKYSR